jgi:hypothetical protein
MVEISHTQGITSLDAPGQEARAIDSLTLNQYHEICYWHLSRFRAITISDDVAVNLGAVHACSQSDQLEVLGESAFLDANVCGRWFGGEGEVMENGWTR